MPEIDSFELDDSRFNFHEMLGYNPPNYMWKYSDMNQDQDKSNQDVLNYPIRIIVEYNDYDFINSHVNPSSSTKVIDIMRHFINERNGLIVYDTTDSNYLDKLNIQNIQFIFKYNKKKWKLKNAEAIAFYILHIYFRYFVYTEAESDLRLNYEQIFNLAKYISNTELYKYCAVHSDLIDDREDNNGLQLDYKLLIKYPTSPYYILEFVLNNKYSLPQSTILYYTLRLVHDDYLKKLTRKQLAQCILNLCYRGSQHELNYWDSGLCEVAYRVIRIFDEMGYTIKLKDVKKLERVSNHIKCKDIIRYSDDNYYDMCSRYERSEFTRSTMDGPNDVPVKSNSEIELYNKMIADELESTLISHFNEKILKFLNWD